MDAAGRRPSGPTSPSVLAMGSGPAIQVDQGGEDAITSLVFKVGSLGAAKSALQNATQRPTSRAEVVAAFG